MMFFRHMKKKNTNVQGRDVEKERINVHRSMKKMSISVSTKMIIKRINMIGCVRYGKTKNINPVLLIVMMKSR